jgi:hypothetical protein
MSMKNSNDTIGNRTRDLPGVLPQPTAPTLASTLWVDFLVLNLLVYSVATGLQSVNFKQATVWNNDYGLLDKALFQHPLPGKEEHHAKCT